MVIVEGGARLRAALVDVYAALGIDWRPATAGAAEDLVRSLSPGDAERALVAALAAHERLTAGRLAPATLELAGTLRSGHDR
jgi:octanoyl-[GcvH]:protein N-octanoyltransferase